MSDLLSVNQALERILARFLPVPAVRVPLEQCLGMVLAEDICATTDLPPFTNSGMDGYALQSGDTLAASPSAPLTLPVVADIPAGKHVPITLTSGQVARVMTGAAIPAGADCVVPVEDVHLPDEVHSSRALPPAITLTKPVQPGAYLRPRGMDIHSGEVVLRAQQRIRVQDLGVLAAFGYALVPVYRRPRLALLSSGDELISPGEALTPGKIRDTNSFTLAALATQAGADVISLGIARDDPRLVAERLEVALDRSADLIITSAGVSVGAYDFVKSVIEQKGNLNFWRVNMRPGKPVAFGSYRGLPLIGLPGNPVSAFVGFNVFVIPAINRLSGLPDQTRQTIKAILEEDVESDGRETYLRAALRENCGKICATLSGHQGSGNIVALAKADALIVIPAGVEKLPAGSEVDAWPLDRSLTRML